MEWVISLNLYRMLYWNYIDRYVGNIGSEIEPIQNVVLKSGTHDKSVFQAFNWTYTECCIEMMQW